MMISKIRAAWLASGIAVAVTIGGCATVEDAPTLAADAPTIAEPATLEAAIADAADHDATQGITATWTLIEYYSDLEHNNLVGACALPSNCTSRTCWGVRTRNTEVIVNDCF